MLRLVKFTLPVLIFSVIIAGIFIVFIRKEENCINLTIVGDVMLSRGVEKYLKEEGYDYPYKNLKDIFLLDDLTVINLECPITDYGRGADKSSRIVFKAESENVPAMKNAGIDLCNLANNHTMDYRSEGLSDTMTELNKGGIDFLGAGKDSKCNMNYIYEKDGFKIGIIAYTMFPPEGFVYNENKTTVNYLLEFGDLKTDRIKADLENLNTDFKIIYFHWGVEFEPFSGELQKELARKAIDSGADFVVGAHPHVIQESEIYKGKYIYYSLGNCIFDRQIPKGTDEGLLLSVKINRNKDVIVEERKFNIIKAQPNFQ